jgi:lipopolysaccharide export system permease protein
VRIFEFDADGRLVTRIARPRVGRCLALDGTWTLTRGIRCTGRGPTGSRFRRPAVVRSGTTSSLAQHARRGRGGRGRAAAVKTMTTLDLWRYSRHLADQEQAAQRHQIQFWKKALYPLACLVMVALALPFAYLHARAGGVSFKVFGGIMLGISFVLLNNVAGHLGLLRGWTPWVAAPPPSLVYLLLSMAAFAWLVRYR